MTAPEPSTSARAVQAACDRLRRGTVATSLAGLHPVLPALVAA